MSKILIRQAKIEDARFLPAIEKSAGKAFRSIPGLEWIADDDVMSAEMHEIYVDEGTVWIAEDEGQLDGFITTRLEVSENCLHILELAVESDHQGKGIGRKLMDTARQHALAQKLLAITLTTFRELSFNEIFYQKLGYRTLAASELSDRLRHILESEAQNGLPGDRRCAMKLTL